MGSRIQQGELGDLAIDPCGDIERQVERQGGGDTLVAHGIGLRHLDSVGPIAQRWQVQGGAGVRAHEGGQVNHSPIVHGIAHLRPDFQITQLHLPGRRGVDLGGALVGDDVAHQRHRGGQGSGIELESNGFFVAVEGEGRRRVTGQVLGHDGGDDGDIAVAQRLQVAVGQLDGGWIGRIEVWVSQGDTLGRTQALVLQDHRHLVSHLDVIRCGSQSRQVQKTVRADGSSFAHIRSGRSGRGFEHAIHRLDVQRRRGHAFSQCDDRLGNVLHRQGQVLLAGQVIPGIDRAQDIGCGSQSDLVGVSRRALRQGFGGIDTLGLVGVCHPGCIGSQRQSDGSLGGVKLVSEGICISPTQQEVDARPGDVVQHQGVGGGGRGCIGSRHQRVNGLAKCGSRVQRGFRGGCQIPGGLRELQIDGRCGVTCGGLLNLIGLGRLDEA